MGILDDAIRQHLDLKRRQGAEEEELERLENEAFGPPSRPGEPDFPDTSEGDALAGEAAEGSAAPEATAVETPLASDLPPEATQPPPEATEPPADQPSEPGPETGEAAVVEDVEDGGDVSPERSSAFYDHAADEEVSAAPEPEPEPPQAASAPAAEEPITAQPTEEQSAIEPPIESHDTVEHPGPAEPPIESHDTVEHSFEDAIGETGEGEVVEGELAEPEEGATEDEDVLEETPEFLRDQPEDDELWFEQGEPKDFDF